MSATSKRGRQPLRDVTVHCTFCRWCPALCGVLVEVAEGSVRSVRGDPEHPLSRGYTCPKGRALGDWHDHPARLHRPTLGRGAARVDADAQDALDDLATIIRSVVAESGPDAIGMYHGTAAFFDASRGVADAFLSTIGSRSRYTSLTIDCPSKPLVGELMAGHRLIPIVDAGRTKLVLLIGTNPVVSHGQNLGWPDPVVRLRQMAADGDLWVVDPRRTESARLARRHLAIRPGTDNAMLAWLVRELLRSGADDEYLARFGSQLNELRTAVQPFDLDTVAENCGLVPADLIELLEAIRAAGRVAVMTGTGPSMGPTANTTEWLAWALMIVTGSYDRPGGMWFNPGYFAQLDTKQIPAGDGVPQEGAPSRPELPRRNDQWPCAAVADEIELGHLRVLFVVGGNPMAAFPQPKRLAAALEKLDALVVLDVVSNDTSALATHVLPCAGQLERADLPLWLNLMQPVVFGQYTPPVLSLPEGRKPLWWYFGQLGRRLGLAVLPAGVDADSATDDDILRPIADGSRSDFATLAALPHGDIADTHVFGWVHERLPAGRWRLAPPELVAQLKTSRTEAGLVLIPRRQMRHLNSGLADTGSGGTSDRPDVLLNPIDAATRDIDDGAVVVVASDAGSLVGVARITTDVRPGVTSVPHGFSEPNVGNLISNEADVDPLTGMVLQSSVPVEVRSARSGPAS